MYTASWFVKAQVTIRQMFCPAMPEETESHGICIKIVSFKWSFSNLDLCLIGQYFHSTRIRAMQPVHIQKMCQNADRNPTTHAMNACSLTRHYRNN